MPKKTKAKTAAVPVKVPQSDEEASSFIREIQDAQLAVTRINSDMEDQLAQIKAASETSAASHTKIIEERTEGLKTWAAANRDRLTNGNKTKTVQLRTGEISWRDQPKSVTLKKVDSILATIRGNLRKYRALLRTKYEVDRAAMLANEALAAEIEGVTINSPGEAFYVKPFGSEIEVVGK
ncbi:MAG: host-nuclease inhibitor Gam family protein [Magnetovibrionaceae bacterium]